MSRNSRVRALTQAALIAGALSGRAAAVLAQTPAPPMPPAAAIRVEYDSDVKPILSTKCFGCHGPAQQLSGLRLDLRQNAMRGGDYGVVIVPGDSAGSKLILRLTGAAVGLPMPPTGALSSDEIGILRAWIDQGADMPGRAGDEVAQVRPTEARVQAAIDRIHSHDVAALRAQLADDRSLARAADGAGTTLLMHAAYAGTLDIMNVLLAAGADVKASNDRKATALHWAAADPAKVKLLLSQGADINARTFEGRTVLHEAAQLPMAAAVVKTLVEAGADVNAKTITGETPLFAAVTAGVESVRLLLDAGAHPNIRSETGRTALMSAGVPGVVGLLLARGADVNVKGKKGETALANAADWGDVDGARMLIEKGADLNVPDYRGYTPLMLAAHRDRDQLDLVRLLLAHGAIPNATGEEETAATLAAKRGDTELARLLKTALASATSPASNDHR